MKPDINSILNNVDPDQLKKPADQDPLCFPNNKWVYNN